MDAVHDLFVDSSRTVEVTEETSQGGELPVHRGGSQMFCFRTVHDPFADVFHGDSPGIEIRFRNIEPLKEVCHVTAVILHRQWGKAADRRQVLQKFLEHGTKIMFSVALTERARVGNTCGFALENFCNAELPAGIAGGLPDVAE